MYLYIIQHLNTNLCTVIQLHVTTSTYPNHRFILPGTHVDDVAPSKQSESHEMMFFFGDIIDGPESIAFHWITHHKITLGMQHQPSVKIIHKEP